MRISIVLYIFFLIPFSCLHIAYPVDSDEELERKAPGFANAVNLPVHFDAAPGLTSANFDSVDFENCDADIQLTAENYLQQKIQIVAQLLSRPLTERELAYVENEHDIAQILNKILNTTTNDNPEERGKENQDPVNNI